MSTTNNTTHFWTTCNTSFLRDTHTGNLNLSASNLQRQRLTKTHVLETTCQPLLVSRLTFYSAFLLLSLFLLFSFVRHHVKYGREDVLCVGIETERHRVVLALCLGTFARALSFVVSEDYMHDPAQTQLNLVPAYVHILLRAIKDICYVQAFSLVVVFWLTLLKTVDGTLHRTSTHRWNAPQLQWVSVIVFAACRIVIALLRAIDVEYSNVDVILFGTLSLFYFVIFVVALVHGWRLHARLKRVGIVVRKNLLRLRCFILVEIMFAVALACSTVLRVLLFSVLDYSRETNPTLHYTIRTIVKGAELGLVGTLTLLMIARSKARNTRTPKNHRLGEHNQTSNTEIKMNDGLDVEEEWKTRDLRSSDTSTLEELPTVSVAPKHIRSMSSASTQSSTNEGALFDRRSFHAGNTMDTLSSSGIEVVNTPHNEPTAISMNQLETKDLQGGGDGGDSGDSGGSVHKNTGAEGGIVNNNGVAVAMCH